jgi:hypothetical protein
MSFMTTPIGSVTKAERLRILDSGYIGIGTINPNNPLEVFNTSSPQLRLSYSPTLFSTIGTDSLGNLNIATTAGNGSSIDIISGQNSGQGNNEAITLKTSQTLSSTDELFQIINNTSQLVTVLGNGYFGIGTTNPGAMLEVNSGIGGTAGLRFTQMTNASSTVANPSQKVLSLDASGNIIMVQDVGGSGGVPGGSANGQTLRWNGSAWSSDGFLTNTGSAIGIGTTGPNNPLEIFNTSSPQLRLSYSSTLFSTIGTDNLGNLNIATTAGNGTGIDIVSGINSGQGNNEAITLKTSQTLSSTDELFQIINNTSQLVTVLGNGNFGIGTTLPKATLDVNAGIGTTNLLSLSYNGTNKLTVSNNGSLQVKTTTSDDVKTTTGTGISTDFETVGSTLQNTVSQSNELDMATGSIPNGGLGNFAMSLVGTTTSVAAGGQVIIRDDGQYIIIGGGTSLTASVWPGTGTTMTQITVAVGATAPGAGAIALKRPDRRYLLVHGNNSGYTSIFDPFNQVAAVAGPWFFGGSTVPAGAGTNAFQRYDGRYVVIGGGTTAWGLYDPAIGTTGIYMGGTGVPIAFGAGAHFLLRDDGNAMVYGGVGNTNVFFYNNTGYMGASTLPAGSMTINPMGTAVSIPAITTTGAFSIRMQNGKYLTLDGGVTSSWIYDASIGQYGTFSRQTGVGMGPNEQLADGAMAVWRSDGKYLLMDGTGLTTTYIIDPSVAVGATMFSIGPSMPAGGAGMAPFMGSDGRYYIVLGAGKSIATYDMGYVMGGTTMGTGVTAAYYESEPINTNNNLNMTSALSWNINTEGTIQFFARTGLGLGVTSSSYKPILRSGDSLGVGNTNDNYVQVKIAFTRSLPTFLDQEWGLRKGNQTRYRRNNSDPVVYDYTVDNSQSVHRSQFDFGDATNGSGPVQSNLINNGDKNLGLSLAIQQNSGGLAAPSSSIMLGAYSPHNPLPSVLGAGVSQTTIVMRRPNGQYAVLVGSTLPYSFIYDPNSQVFSVGASTPTAKVGAGALAFKRPDGKFLVVLGDGGSTTNIYDPVTDTYAMGPALTGNAGFGAMAIPLPSGRVMIVHGNLSVTTSIYDPFMNTMVPGVWFSGPVGAGAINIPRPDGTFLVAMGSSVNCGTMPAITNIFNPYTMTVGQTSPVVTAVAGKGIGPGSIAIPRTDGNWLIVLGAGATSAAGLASFCTTSANTSLYNPTINHIVAGPSLTANVGYGAHAIPRADGRWLIILGGGTTVTNIYDASASGAFVADIGIGGSFFVGPNVFGTVGGVGATWGGATGGGSISFQRDDGQFVTILGAGGTGVNQLDALWVSKGIYKSEEMYVSDLDSNSALTWKASPSYTGITAEIKTAPTQNGIQTATGRSMATPDTLINPGTLDKWVQVTFNFKRTFPSYGGIVNDVWYNNTSQSLLTNRTILTPTLNEFTITKDVSLVNLQADGMSVFRVGSNGNIYTSASGTVNSGGADLAENYTSDQDLQKGELVSIDPTNNHAVQRSKYQYEPDLVGVVSTDPGFVAGAFTDNSYPIALVGRVPVKVSTENGMIAIGDRLTSSSTPGYAMKAVKAGRVIGKALESLNPTTLTDCPQSDFGNQGQKCGSVMTFVNLSDYLGMPVEMAMAESNREIGANVGSSVPGWMSDSDEKILQFLSDNKDNTAAAQPSDIFADRVVSTKIVADTIIANKIKANSIEGLEVFTNQIGSLNDKYNQLASQVAGAATGSAVVSITPTGGPLSQIFNFNGQSQFSGNLLVKALTEFWDKVLFKEEVTFQKTPVFNKEMAGFAVIDAGQTGVDVVFDQAYAETPVVNVTMVVEDGQEQPVLDQGYVYFVTRKSANGFTIRLNKSAADKVQFSWSALAVKDAKTYEISITPVPSEVMPTITGIPTITVTPTDVIPTQETGATSADTGTSAVTN